MGRARHGVGNDVEQFRNRHGLAFGAFMPDEAVSGGRDEKGADKQSDEDGTTVPVEKTRSSRLERRIGHFLAVLKASRFRCDGRQAALGQLARDQLHNGD